MFMLKELLLSSAIHEFICTKKRVPCGLYMVGVGTLKGAEIDPWTLYKGLHDPKETLKMSIQYSGLKCDREKERDIHTHTFHLVILCEQHSVTQKQ